MAKVFACRRGVEGYRWQRGFGITKKRGRLLKQSPSSCEKQATITCSSYRSALRNGS